MQSPHAKKNGAEAPLHRLPAERTAWPINRSAIHQTENDEPQPHVVDAFGFLMTNCAPLISSL